MPRSPRVARLLILLPFAVLTLTGCGSDPLNAASVVGKVTVDGQPLTKGSVRFIPDKAKGNNNSVEPVGTISETGQYELATNGKPGAPLGWYKVVVISSETPDSTKPSAQPKSYVARKFNDPATSGLSAEVVSSPKAGAYDLTVTAK